MLSGAGKMAYSSEYKRRNTSSPLDLNSDEKLGVFDCFLG